ncbi:MAG: DUF2461 domain-containing protein [Bacteroidetes bacterium]|nr:DUF2461 domain-containing protein [Bacteroidota bacterium]
MKYFNKAYIQFFKELAKENHKEWFDLNRKTYEIEVKKPFENFTQDLANTIYKFDSEVNTDYKKAIFRINKDIRFSKDKSPYKLNRSCAISKFGKKDHESPGYYVEISADKVSLAGGAWSPSTESLFKIRQEISYNMKEFEKLTKDKKFIEAFGEIRGEKNKQIPKEFMEDAKAQPLIFNKQFYFWKEYPASLVCSDKLLETIISDFKTILPMNQFLRRAME